MAGAADVPLGVWVALAAGAGAATRYAVDRLVQRVTGGTLLPWGTFLVNAAGSFLLGLLVGAAASGALPPQWRTVLGTGFAGGLTTFSTWSWETVRLVEDGAVAAAVRYVVASLVVGLAAAAAGVALAR